MKKGEVLIWSGTVYRGREPKCGDCKKQLVFSVPRPEIPCRASKPGDPYSPRAHREGSYFFCEEYGPKLSASVRNAISEAAIFIRRLGMSLPV